ncbi:hypothetical protein LCM15_02995 [Salipiger bermudensis]|nr:hypothetical protein [Salipiger bermudensis]
MADSPASEALAAADAALVAAARLSVMSVTSMDRKCSTPEVTPAWLARSCGRKNAVSSWTSIAAPEPARPNVVVQTVTTPSSEISAAPDPSCRFWFSEV